MNAPLLLFRLHTIAKNAFWSDVTASPLPEGCAAIAVSGGMADLWERRQGKFSEPVEGVPRHPLSPFLGSAPDWVATRVIWALTGPGGRFYPIYRTSVGALALGRIDPSVLPDAKFDVLASLKLQSLQAALSVNWVSNFTTCFSDGLGLGFWGEIPKLERKLRKADSFVPFRSVADGMQESISERMEGTHPFLQASWQENGLEWLVQNAPLVTRPQGWEGQDIIVLSSKMSHDEMIGSIRRSLGSELQIAEFDGDDEYRKWTAWPWPANPSRREDPWPGMPAI